jgi:hypothetical protein
MNKTERVRQTRTNFYFFILHEDKVITTFICSEPTEDLSMSGKRVYNSVKEVRDTTENLYA